MYPEKPKREEKPKRGSRKHKQALARAILALLFLVPTLLMLFSRFNQEQFVHMALLTLMITLGIYIVYQMVLIFFATLHDIHVEARENRDL